MQLKKELREFIKWQLKHNLLKEPLTIDYELAESYLESEEQQFSLQGVLVPKGKLCCEPEDYKMIETGSIICKVCKKTIAI